MPKQGKTNFKGPIHLPDSVKVYLGSSDDISMHWDGSNGLFKWTDESVPEVILTFNPSTGEFDFKSNALNNGIIDGGDSTN